MSERENENVGDVAQEPESSERLAPKPLARPMIRMLFGEGETLKLNVLELQKNLIANMLRVHIASIDKRLESCDRCPIICENPGGFVAEPAEEESDRMKNLPALGKDIKLPYYEGLEKKRKKKKEFEKRVQDLQDTEEKKNKEAQEERREIEVREATLASEFVDIADAKTARAETELAEQVEAFEGEAEERQRHLDAGVGREQALRDHMRDAAEGAASDLRREQDQTRERVRQERQRADTMVATERKKAAVALEEEGRRGDEDVRAVQDEAQENHERFQKQLSNEQPNFVLRAYNTLRLSPKLRRTSSDSDVSWKTDLVMSKTR